MLKNKLLGATSHSIRGSVMSLLLGMGARRPVTRPAALEDVIESLADRGGSRRGVLSVLQVRVGRCNRRRWRREILRVVRIG